MLHNKEVLCRVHIWWLEYSVSRKKANGPLSNESCWRVGDSTRNHSSITSSGSLGLNTLTTLLTACVQSCQSEPNFREEAASISGVERPGTWWINSIEYNSQSDLRNGRCATVADTPNV